MKLLIALIFIASCSQLKTKPLIDLESASILQLATSDTRAEFNVMLLSKSEPHFTVITPGGMEVKSSRVEVSQQPETDWAIYHVLFENLPSSPEAHQLRIQQADKIIDQRLFHTFSEKGDRLKFVVGSCMDWRFQEEQEKIWLTIAQEKPEWIFLIGDNAYLIDSQTELHDARQLWEAFANHRLSLSLYQWKNLVPIHAVWDDNDSGQKDGHRLYPLRAEAQRFFRAFFQPRFQHDLLTSGPGVASRLALRGMHFTFLDNRSYRDSSKEGEHFGSEQENWLITDLKSAALPTWIISGDQFFGGYHGFESYEGKHPMAFERFMGQLKEVPTPFVFLSGDRHLSEIMQFPKTLLGQLSFEFTSSPLHAKTYAGSLEQNTNPWRVVGVDGLSNFLIFDTWLEETSWNIHVTAKDLTGKLLFRRDLSLTTEALKDFTIEKKQKRRKYRRARWRRR